MASTVQFDSYKTYVIDSFKTKYIAIKNFAAPGVSNERSTLIYVL